MPEARNHLVEVPSAELQVRALAKLPQQLLLMCEYLSPIGGVFYSSLFEGRLQFVL